VNVEFREFENSLLFSTLSPPTNWSEARRQSTIRNSKPAWIILCITTTGDAVSLEKCVGTTQYCGELYRVHFLLTECRQSLESLFNRRTADEVLCLASALPGFVLKKGMFMADNSAAPTPSPDNPAEPKKELTAEEKMARLQAMRAANAAKAAAAKAGGAAPATPGAPAPAAAAPAAAAPAAAAAGEPKKELTAEEKMARLQAARAANAAKAAGKPVPAAAAAPVAAAAPAATAAAPSAPKTFPPKAGESKESGVEASGAPANKPASTHLAGAATAKAAPKTKAAEVPLPPPPQLQTRRTFLEWGFAAWVFFFAFLGAVHALFLRFMFPNVLYEQDPRFVAGKRSDFPEVNKVYENYKQSQAVWIVRLLEEGQDRLVALSTVCTHLGCTPNWLDAERKFKCPCHGSGYYLSGVNFEGPTPRPLERFRVYVDATGNVVVDKSKKFRKDLQQWNQPESFITMG
jgi:cytochrome b6-f complex iron-sulfur subunit